MGPSLQTEGTQGEQTMKLIHDLFLTDYGFLSLAVIVFLIGMPIFIAWWVKKQMSQQDQNQKL
ncbi:MAG: hypothetical protein RL320_1429 [Pseudomonadota bacterium]